MFRSVKNILQIELDAKKLNRKELRQAVRELNRDIEDLEIRIGIIEPECDTDTWRRLKRIRDTQP